MPRLALFLLSSLVVGAAAAQAQLAESPKETVAIREDSIDGEIPAAFQLPGTESQLLYPKTVRPEPPIDASGRPYRAAYGNPKEWPAGRCFSIVAQFGAGDPVIHYDDPNAKHFTPSPPTGGLVVQEIIPHCFSDVTANEQLLAGLVAGPDERSGFKSFAKTVNYHLGDAKVYFHSIHADSMDADGVRRASAGQTLLALLALEYRGHVFLFTSSANDVKVFQELLKLQIRLAKDEKPWPLVPFRFGPSDGQGDKNALPQ